MLIGARRCSLEERVHARKCERVLVDPGSDEYVVHADDGHCSSRPVSDVVGAAGGTGRVAGVSRLCRCCCRGDLQLSPTTSPLGLRAPMDVCCQLFEGVVPTCGERAVPWGLEAAVVCSVIFARSSRKCDLQCHTWL